MGEAQTLDNCLGKIVGADVLFDYLLGKLRLRRRRLPGTDYGKREQSVNDRNQKEEATADHSSHHHLLDGWLEIQIMEPV